MRFARQSQSCTAGSRLFLHADIFDPFLDRLKEKTSAQKIGDPLDEATDIGAIINEKQFRKICSYVEDGLHQPAARLVMGGLPPKTGPLSEGYFALPTVFADASNDWGWRARRSSGWCWSRSPGPTRPRPSAWRTTATTASPPMSGPTDIGRALRTAHAIEAGWVQVNQGLGQCAGPFLWRL